MIYTSYFAKLKKLQAWMNKSKVSVTTMSIASMSPKWYQGLKAVDIPETAIIVPPKRLVIDYLKGRIDSDEYTKVYYKQLQENKKAILLAASCFDDFVLLCYEKPGEFCHRNLLSIWLSDNGYPCKELAL